MYKGITRKELTEELLFLSKRLKSDNESNISNMKDSEYTKLVELEYGIPIDEICSEGDESVLSRAQQFILCHSWRFNRLFCCQSFKWQCDIYQI
jgi:hypothetical protein